MKRAAKLAAALLVPVALHGATALGQGYGIAARLLAGGAHATIYLALLVIFGRTLRSGRTALVTRFARQLNPAFHPGMIRYTRAVTWAWCGLFAGQLLLSAGLAPVRPELWLLFVTTLHLPLVGLMALAEFGVRRWRWRHEHSTGLRDTIAGVRRIIREGAAARAEAAERTSTPV